MLPRLFYSPLVLAFAAYLRSASPSAAAAAVIAPAPITIGVGAPMSGSDAIFGAQIRNGVEQAVRDINAGGGILGHKLEVSVGDDTGDPETGMRVAEKFVADHVPFIIGHFNSGVTMPTSALYAAHDILEITPSTTYPPVTERGFAALFRTCGRDDQQVGVAATFLTAQIGKKIAVVSDATHYGQAQADLMRRALAAHHIAPVLATTVSGDAADDNVLITELKAAGADFIFWSGPPEVAGRLLKELRAQGDKAKMLGGVAIASDIFAADGGDAVIGTLMTFPRDPTLAPQAAAVVKEFKARGLNPETYTLNAYAAVEIIKEAAEKAKSLDPAAIAKQMHSGQQFTTVLGDISYDARGDLTQPDYSIFVWKKLADGKLDFAPLPP